jgi:hypothetical protein
MGIMATIIDTSADSEIFARVISADEALSPDIARSVLAWTFPEEDRELVRELQDKNNSGTITDSEQRMLESYVRVGQFVAVMQARARLALKEYRGQA